MRQIADSNDPWRRSRFPIMSPYRRPELAGGSQPYLPFGNKYKAGEVICHPPRWVNRVGESAYPGYTHLGG